MNRNQFLCARNFRQGCFIEAQRDISPILIGQFYPELIEAKRKEMGTSFDERFDILSEKNIHELIGFMGKGCNIIICDNSIDFSVGQGVLAAFREFFFHDGIEIFRDYRCSPDKLYFNLVYECLIRYDTKKGISGPDKDGIL